MGICRLINCLSPIESRSRTLQHLVNIALHGIVTVLVLNVLRKLLALVAVDPQRAHQLAFVSAALFAVHPVHTECVSGSRKLSRFRNVQIANVTGRAELLSGVCFLMAIETYCESIVADRTTIAPTLWTFVGLLCKEQCLMALVRENSSNIHESTVQLFCLCFEFALIGIRRPNAHRITTTFVAMGTMTVWRMWLMNFSTPKFTKYDNPAAHHELRLVRIINYLYIHLLNVKLLFAPLELCFDYSMGCIPLIENVLADTRFYLVLCAICAGISSAVLLMRTEIGANHRWGVCNFAFHSLQTAVPEHHPWCDSLSAFIQSAGQRRLRAGRARALFAVDRRLFAHRDRHSETG